MMSIGKSRKKSTSHRKETRRKCGGFTGLAGVVGFSLLLLVLQLNYAVLHTLKEKNAAITVPVTQESTSQESIQQTVQREKSAVSTRKTENKQVNEVRIENKEQQPSQQTPQQLQRQEEAQKRYDDTVENEEIDNNRYHLAFSTSCSKKDWQSYLFFYLAMAHKQQGDVTHIVSGCKDQQTEDELRQLHNEHHTQAMSENFHIHFTPDFSDPTNFQVTKYWNKPFGVNHWLENRFGFRYDLEKGDVAESTDYDDDVSTIQYIQSYLDP
jgi:type II secretory pathway component PulJ